MKQALSRKNLWNRTPAWAKAILGRGLRIVPLTWLLGRSFRRTYEFVQAAQWWSAEEARAYQLEQLRSICSFAQQKSRYYRRVFDTVGFHPEALRTLEDLSGLPTIDKRTIRKHADELCTMPPCDSSVDLCSTGGTGGAPLMFYMDRARSAIEYAYLVTSWERAGYRLGTPMGVLRGRTLTVNRRKGFHYAYDPLLDHHYYSSYHLTDTDMRRYLEHLATLGPCFLHVYPSSVAILSRFVRRSGVAVPANLLGIIAESENIYPDQRADIEDTFKVRMFSDYGHSEKLVFAAECEHSTDYHVWPTYGYLELLDEQGHSVAAPGQRGEIVGTGFINRAMPFIRYRTGDYATYVGGGCAACGREQVVLRDIRGHRTQEILIAADGTALPWTGMTADGDAFLRVRQFQFYQDTPGRAVLRIVPAEGYGRPDEQQIREFYLYKFAGTIDFTMELTDAIPLSPRGKAIYVDQRIRP
jgi:phenylacetate-CoA ligase